MWRRYIFWFAHELLDFRHAELESIRSMYNIPIKWVERPCQEKPYWIVELEKADDVYVIASRSISIRYFIELWSQASTIAQLHINLNESLTNYSEQWLTKKVKCEDSENLYDVCPRSLMENCFAQDKSFKITVETFCKHFSLEEKLNKLETFDYMPFEGPVRLKKPDNEIMYLEFYGVDPNNIPPAPYQVFFGKLIADGQRQLITKLSLKTRKFIGNTTMDPQLSLLMANQAQVKSGDLVVDPFVGSGSLLVGAAQFGGYVLGSDIDYMMVHGRTKPTRVTQKVREEDESIRANMKQYELQSRYLDVAVSDFSLPLWREGVCFDAILTDPPYGIREPTEKIGIERDNYSLSEQHLPNHIPAKVDYDLSNIFKDLLAFAGRHLEVGRRLVCWYPLVRSEYSENCLPSHPSLRLVANSEQILSKLTSRRLLTFEKISNDSNFTEFDQEAAAAKAMLDFREKYFGLGEETRNERKKQKALTKELVRQKKEKYGVKDDVR